MYINDQDDEKRIPFVRLSVSASGRTSDNLSRNLIVLIELGAHVLQRSHCLCYV